MSNIFDNIDASIFNEGLQGVEMLLDNACNDLRYDITDVIVCERDKDDVIQTDNGDMYIIHHDMDFTPDMYSVEEHLSFLKFVKRINKFMPFKNLIFKKADLPGITRKPLSLKYTLIPKCTEYFEGGPTILHNRWLRSYEYNKLLMGSALKNGIRSTAYEETLCYAFDFEVLKIWMESLYWMLHMYYQCSSQADVKDLIKKTKIFFIFQESWDSNDLCLNTLEEYIEFFQWCVDNEEVTSTITLSNPKCTGFGITLFTHINQHLPVNERLVYDDYVEYQKYIDLDCYAREMLELINNKIK